MRFVRVRLHVGHTCCCGTRHELTAGWLYADGVLTECEPCAGRVLTVC